ncbi:MAG: amidohydrolase [Crocinitomicaceae bacterium]
MEVEDFIKIRKLLHQHPELSGQEKKTKAYIHQMMLEFWPTATFELDNHKSLIASRSDGNSNHHIAIRCELDALPIEEVNTFEHRSLNTGNSHKCGHDGHMTILLRLAYLLEQDFPENCRVTLIFQSAEENGIGAKELLDQSAFLKSHPLDFIFALHNVPSYKKGSVVVKNGLFTPSVISVKTKLIGKASHAAEPENGTNPALAIAAIIQKTEALKQDFVSAYQQFISTPVYTKLGSESYGTSAGEAAIGYTFRTTDYQSLMEFKKKYEQSIHTICENEGLKYAIQWFEEFPSVINNIDATELIQQSAQERNYEIIQKDKAFPWGEDFGYFTQTSTGAMFGLGAGENIPNLHNPDYDFQDELIEIGSNIFFEIIQKAAKC